MGVARLLLKAGARLHATDMRGATPLQVPSFSFFGTRITTCYPDRVATGPHFVPGLPFFLSLSQVAGGSNAAMARLLTQAAAARPAKPLSRLGLCGAHS